MSRSRILSQDRHKMGLDVFQVFIGLPTSLSCSLLGDWMDLKTICRLDSALCEKVKSVKFLSVLQSAECVGKFVGFRTEGFKWLNRRSVRTSELFLSEAFSTDICKDYLERFGHNIRSLKLGGRSSDKFLDLIAQNCHNLICFHSYSLSCDMDKCGEVFRLNRNLRDLTLYNAVHKPSLSAIQLPNLAHLCLFGRGSQDQACVDLVKSTKRLVFLSLGSTRVSSTCIIEVIQHFTNLLYFEPPSVPDIDALLSEISKVCIYIQHLDLELCKNLSDAGVIAIAENVRALRSLHFTYSPRITNACLDSLATHQHNSFEIFSVFEDFAASSVTITDNALTFNSGAVTAFRKRCKKLRVSDWQRHILMSSEIGIPTIVSHIMSADRVTTLSIQYVSDAILTAIASNCKQLELLDVQCCDPTCVCSDEAWVTVAENCSTLRVVNVDVSLVPALEQLFSSYPTIQVISNSSSLFSYDLKSMYRKDYNWS